MNPQINEHDEFLLNGLLDGDLPAAEAEALRQRIAGEPALRATFERLVRLDAVLTGRRAERVGVDWGRFHQAVMKAVEAEAEAVPATIRLGRWLRIGLPLAAAAAIALVVSLYPSSVRPGGTGTPVSPGPLAAALRTGSAGGQLVVEFQHPAPEGETPEGEVHIRYTQSAQLAEAIEQEDNASESRPPVVFATTAAPVSRDRLVSEILEAPPM